MSENTLTGYHFTKFLTGHSGFYSILKFCDVSLLKVSNGGEEFNPSAEQEHESGEYSCEDTEVQEAQELPYGLDSSAIVQIVGVA